MSEAGTSVAAVAEADLAEVRRLLRAFAAWLPHDLCLRDFEAELAALPSDYAPPAGGLWLGRLGRRRSASSPCAGWRRRAPAS